ncbi:hypothetical protein GCM10020295_72900 [Streptomyces cinereospinus]
MSGVADDGEPRPPWPGLPLAAHQGRQRDTGGRPTSPVEGSRDGVHGDRHVMGAAAVADVREPGAGARGTYGNGAHGVPALPGAMLYLGCGRARLPLRAESDAGMLLLGGEPFAEELIMWWNFVGRSRAEIEQARADWLTGGRFGEVRGYDGAPSAAPELPATPLRPRGRFC